MKSNALRFPIFGWVGLAIMALAELALLLKMGWVATWFTPIMWSGYIVFMSGLLQKTSGRSWFTDSARELPLLALISTLVWLLFEAYNLHMVNWLYRGLPESSFWRDFGYFWSFATIMPGVFVTFKLVRALWPSTPSKPMNANSTAWTGPSWLWFILGLLMVVLPLLLPTEMAAYLFAFVWLGFILMLDPINEGLGLPSLRLQWRKRSLRETWQWLLAGLICGLLWETWNFQTYLAGGAHWVYTVPSALRFTGLHFGQMPVEGLLGFPPFALELRAFYLWLRQMLGGDSTLGPSLLDI